jgi:hypothetical protein
MLAMVNVAGGGSTSSSSSRTGVAGWRDTGRTRSETIGRLGRLGAGAGARRNSTREAYERNNFVGQRPKQALSLCVSIYGARKKCEVADCLRASGGRLARVRHAISFTDGLERARQRTPPPQKPMVVYPRRAGVRSGQRTLVAATLAARDSSELALKADTTSSGRQNKAVMDFARSGLPTTERQ